MQATMQLLFVSRQKTQKLKHVSFIRFLAVMQRASRLKRELQMLSTEPPPGISCWQAEDRTDELRARQYPHKPK